MALEIFSIRRCSMETFKLLVKAFLPIFGLVAIAIIAFVLFNYFPNSEQSEDNDIQILMGFWLLSMPIVLAFIAIKSNKKNKG